MVHGLRFRIAGWRGGGGDWLLFCFLGFRTGERRRLAAGSLRARGLRRAGPGCQWSLQLHQLLCLLFGGVGQGWRAGTDGQARGYYVEALTV